MVTQFQGRQDCFVLSRFSTDNSLVNDDYLSMCFSALSGKCLVIATGKQAALNYFHPDVLLRITFNV